eukprot:UN34718
MWPVSNYNSIEDGGVDQFDSGNHLFISDHVVSTCGGTAPHNSKCQFPFEYHGVTYDRCITDGHDQPWCYTNEEELEWGNCECKKTCEGTAPQGSICHFPFEYGGETHYSCTNIDEEEPRCYVNEAETEWAYCDCDEDGTYLDYATTCSVSNNNEEVWMNMDDNRFQLVIVNKMERESFTVRGDLGGDGSGL